MSLVVRHFGPGPVGSAINLRKTRMNTPSKRRPAQRLGAVGLSASLLMQTVLPAHAAVSQLPGLYNAPPDANVMFTLDDSLSMASDAIPDFISDQVGMPNADGNSTPSDGLNGQAGQQRARFPGMWKLNTLYWGTTYYRDDNRIARYMRSAAGNPLYYNPEVRYQPWPDANNDKSFNANANPAAVNIDTASPFNNAFTRNLTVRVNESGSAIDLDDQTRNFWPATYYVYTGATTLRAATPNTAFNVQASFRKVVVRGTGLATYDKGPSRLDCTGAVGTGLGGCTRVQELQNFANWLQYYRTRMLMAKGGVSAAFAQQQSNLRVGFGTINSANTVRQGVATFSGARRTSFYTDLYGIAFGTGGTPLRRAADDVGKYFLRSNIGNPWAENPGSTTTVGTEYTCRKSIHVLSTDGFWNGTAAGTEGARDNDTFSGTTPARPDGTTYTYGDTSIDGFGLNPFRDGRADTLADVAAYYWKTDLRTLANEVPGTTHDPAFWQHLSTYTVGLGVSGTGTVKPTGETSTLIPAGHANPVFARYPNKPWLEVQAVRDELVAKKIPMDWTVPAADAATTGDDLVHASMNGRGRYYSASDPTKLKNGLGAALAEAADLPRSLASIATQAPQLTAGSLVFQATYNPSQWSGRFYAFTQAASGAVTTTPGSEVWEASNMMPAPGVRNIYTWNPITRAGSPFTWAGLTPTQQLDLGADFKVLDYLRGSDANETSKGGVLRDRARYAKGSVAGGVLGDIVNGSPIKGPTAGGGYQKLAAGSPGRDTYAAFRSPTNTALDMMRNTLFLGANDGMLHAFEQATGVERFAFVPNAVFSVPRSSGTTERKLAMLSDPGYTHRFTVDGAPQVGDAFIGGTAAPADWRTVLISGHGAGARSVFAMDVTDPSVSTNGFGATKVMWEFSDSNHSDMGYVNGYPHIARMRDGTWVAIFGNGYDSVGGQAKLFVLNLQTGAVLWQPSVGTAGGNGLSQPNFTVNKDREVTAIYAGDQKGNLWKFDVDNADPTQWKVAFGDAPNYTPLFENSDKQPIRVMPELTGHPNGGTMVTFGTGSLFDDSDVAASGATPANVNLNTQAMYGIWDKPAQSTGFTGLATLVEQSISAARSAVGNTTGTTMNTVDWASKRGWYFNLRSGGERVNVNPLQINKVLLIVANRPDADPCKSGGAARLFALDPITGGVPSFEVFDANGRDGINSEDRGYNVKSYAFGVMSLPVLQSKIKDQDVLRPESAHSRGQTSARAGGVFISSQSSSNLPCEGDGSGTVLVGSSDTTIGNVQVQTCKKKARISWRQLK